jgi:hypothetical protein
MNNNHTHHFTTCNQHITFTPEQLLMTGIKWSCPTCYAAINLSQSQLSRPGVSPQAKELWTFIGAAAVAIGIVTLIDRLTTA